MMACAFTGPIPSSVSSCSRVAVLMFTAAIARPTHAISAAKSNAILVMLPPLSGSLFVVAKAIIRLRRRQDLEADIVEAGLAGPLERGSDLDHRAVGGHGDLHREALPARGAAHQPPRVDRRVSLHEGP